LRPSGGFALKKLGAVLKGYKGLQRLLGLVRYQTAWAWLHILRSAMIRVDREPLEGPMEIDYVYIEDKEQGVIACDTIKKAKIVVAVEIPGRQRKHIGRVRIDHVEDFSAISLLSFVLQNVQPGSEVITDG
jgi:hypothetical protein